MQLDSTPAAPKVIVLTRSAELLASVQRLLGNQFELKVHAYPPPVVELTNPNAPVLALVETDASDPNFNRNLEFCRMMKSLPMPLPVIALTSRSTESAFEALKAGVDDYVQRLNIDRDLIPRTKARLRLFAERYPVHIPLKLGNLEVDFSQHEARVNGKKVPLTLLEFKLLSCFVNNSHQVLNREKIVKSVWQNSYVAERTVDVHIVALRKKLKDSDYSPNTVYGVGYIFKDTDPADYAQSV